MEHPWSKGIAMNRFDKVALCAVIGVTLFPGVHALMISNLYLRDASATQAVLWFTGQILLTYGPIAAGVLCWRWSKHTRLGWLLHVLFFPSAVLLFRMGAALMLRASDHMSFDDTIGTPIMAGMLLFVIAVGTYAAALLSRIVAAASREPAA
ncbi:hypothetical protein ACCC88_12265 [Sphingomonas sp. Sphisp140]|uniref:hypothetical protein n=1 Tax=unclassified Sphingomonas TaxID=196159 RepID=UPI0039AF6B40